MGRRPREVFSACMSVCCRRAWCASCFAASWAADKPPAPCPPPRRRFCWGVVSTAAGKGASAPPSTAAWTSSSLGGWRCQEQGTAASQLTGGWSDQSAVACLTAAASMGQPVQVACMQCISAGSLQVGTPAAHRGRCGVQSGVQNWLLQRCELGQGTC